jgi:hypothetical protein
MSASDKTVELYSVLCDTVERAWHNWPVAPEADEPFNTSSYAREGANRIMDALADAGVDAWDL